MPHVYLKAIAQFLKFYFLLVFCILGLLFSSYAQNKTIALTTSSREALVALLAGRDLFENQHLDKAQTYFTKAITKDPGCAIAYLYLAQASPIPSSAYVQNLQKAVSLMPKASEGERLLIEAEHAYAEGLASKATSLLQKLTRQFPADKRGYLFLAAHNLRLLDYTRAQTTLSAGLTLDPDFPAYSLQQGHIAALLGQFPEASQAFQTYQRLLPDEPNGFLALGHLYLKQGLYTKAIQSFTTALQLDPQFFPAYTALGMGYLANKQLTEARQQAEKLLELAPTPSWRRQAHFLLSATYALENKQEKALAELQKSKKIAEETGDQWEILSEVIKLGDFYLAQGKSTEAKTNLQQATLLVSTLEGFDGIKHSASRQVLAKEAETALVSKDLPAARKKINEHQKQATIHNDPYSLLDSHRLLGMVALQEKKYEEALKEFSQANLQDARTWYLTGTTYLAKGEKAQARLHWATAAQFIQLDHEHLFLRQKANLF